MAISDKKTRLASLGVFVVFLAAAPAVRAEGGFFVGRGGDVSDNTAALTVVMHDGDTTVMTTDVVYIGAAGEVVFVCPFQRE